MLRSEHAILRYDFDQATVAPDRLVRGRHSGYLSIARTMLQVYRKGAGRTRQSLHRDIDLLLSRLPDCSPRRIAAFCKLLDDQAIYRQDKRAAVALREQVFSLAAPLHPLVEQQAGIFDQTIEMARSKISQTLGISWQEIDAKLFSDVVELQTLSEFNTAMTPTKLLSQYNVAQAQAALYRAIQVCIEARGDLKTIMRHIKLAGLMHQITRLDDQSSEYRFVLDGPQSALRETTRYGVRYARMLPKLLACRPWRLSATVIGPGRRKFDLRLSSQDGLKSPHSSPDPFDSLLEQQVAKVWDSAPVAGWTLEREPELLHQGQHVLTPDFVLRQRSTGRRIYLEVVGYWTPEYLAEKARKLTMFADGNRQWLLIFPKRGAAARQTRFSDLPVSSIEFDQSQSPQQWIEAVSHQVGQAGSDH